MKVAGGWMKYHLYMRIKALISTLRNLKSVLSTTTRMAGDKLVCY